MLSLFGPFHVIRLQTPYIAQKPMLISHSIEHRLLWQHCLINFVKGRGLLIVPGFYSIAFMGEVSSYLFTRMRVSPALVTAYASGCAGKQLLELLCVLTAGEGKRWCPFWIALLRICHEVCLATNGEQMLYTFKYSYPLPFFLSIGISMLEILFWM